MTYLSQTRKTQKSYRSQREKMEKIKLFYKDVDGKETYLIAECQNIEIASKNAVKEFQVLREIYGENTLPISNITRMDKIVDK